MHLKNGAQERIRAVQAKDTNPGLGRRAEMERAPALGHRGNPTRPTCDSASKDRDDSTQARASAKLAHAPMTSLRHQLRLWVAAWLIAQVATLSAVVPRDCCAAHNGQHTKSQQASAKADHSGHHEMNHGTVHESADEATRKVPIANCVMRGTCKGPMSALVALLSNQGVPPIDAFTISPDFRATVIAGPTREQATSRLASPDPPPPRA